jgi:hypothetical protein
VRRRLAITAAVLVGAGLAMVLWYAVWGVRGCDQSQATCDRMDRDFVINAIGLGSIALGVVLAAGAAMTQRDARRHRRR